MATTTVFSDGVLSLSGFQTTVQQNEEIFGPLKALGKKADKNSINYEIGTSPENLAILEVFTGKSAPNKSGHQLICTGDCLIKAKPAQVAAYRNV